MAQDVSCLGTDDVPSECLDDNLCYRVVRESISISFTMFTGAGISLASNAGTLTASVTRTPCVTLQW